MLNPKSARAILSLYLPDAGKEVPPDIEKALAFISTHKEERAGFERQAELDRVTRERLEAIEVPPAISDRLAAKSVALAGQRGRLHFRPTDPATLAVSIGFLLLLAVVGWFCFLRPSAMPDEAFNIASAAVQSRPEQFQQVDQPAGSLEDWFALQGFEQFRVPAKFASLPAAGVRFFKVENTPVAVLAVPQEGLLLLVFDPAPFGIEPLPPGTWRTGSFEEKGTLFSAALSTDGGSAFLVVAPGDVSRLAPWVGKPAPGGP